jgi:murein DD-endopeptidase MepM/ murein hydrolase activator NlpD
MGAKDLRRVRLHWRHKGGLHLFGNKRKTPMDSADIKRFIREVAAVLSVAYEATYRFNYALGMRVLRRLHSIRRRSVKALVPYRRQLTLLWRRVVTRRVRRVQRAWKFFLAGFPIAGREVASAAKRSVFAVFPCFGQIVARALRRHRRHFARVWVLAGPVAALIVFGVTIGAWTNTEFCLSLNYRGQPLGYIDNALVYDTAADMAIDRVVNVDNSFSVDAAPSLTIAIKGDNAVMNDSELCDAILRTAGDSIAEATGLYVDGAFIGAMESNGKLNAVLDGLKDGLYDKNDPTQRAEFIQQVETVEGLFPAASVIDQQTLKAQLTAERVVKKTYVVQAGDTLSTIAVRNNMTTAELRSMNPKFAKTDIVRIGDELVVQKPQSFLQVKVIKTIQYTEKIDYTTVYTNNTSKPVTWSIVKTKGQEGSQDIVAEITYIDGVESARKILSKTVTKQPVTKVVERGTRPVYANGNQVVVGDGVTKGQMSWPVPICSNMSRGWQSGHYALDIANGPVTVRNKPACAADGGKVTLAGWNGAYGYCVKIQHANGLETLYAHLNSISVVKGQTVSRNQTIGLIGSTGRSTGPHLHFEVLKNGVRVNPLRYVTPGKIYR